MRNRFRRSARFGLLIVESFLAFLGYHLDKGNPWAISLFAKEHVRAQQVYEATVYEGGEIGRGDPGFDELLKVLSKRTSGPIGLIPSLNGEPWAKTALLEDGYVSPLITLHITFMNRQSQDLKIRDLGADREEYFLKHTLLA